MNGCRNGRLVNLSFKLSLTTRVSCLKDANSSLQQVKPTFWMANTVYSAKFWMLQAC